MNIWPCGEIGSTRMIEGHMGEIPCRFEYGQGHMKD